MFTQTDVRGKRTAIVWMDVRTSLRRTFSNNLSRFAPSTTPPANKPLCTTPFTISIYHKGSNTFQPSAVDQSHYVEMYNILSEFFIQGPREIIAEFITGCTSICSGINCINSNIFHWLYGDYKKVWFVDVDDNINYCSSCLITSEKDKEIFFCEARDCNKVYIQNTADFDLNLRCICGKTNLICRRMKSHQYCFICGSTPCTRDHCRTVKCDGCNNYYCYDCCTYCRACKYFHCPICNVIN